MDSLPTYFMSSLLIPLLILQNIDRKGKAFFWGQVTTFAPEPSALWHGIEHALPKKRVD
jgi:hypothetical protein